MQVYRHGRKFLSEELARRVNGVGLDPGPYLEYLRGKFGALYGLGDGRPAVGSTTG